MMLAWLFGLPLGCQGELEETNLGLQAPTAAPVPDGIQRPWRRMDLDQLDASMRKVTGGIGWEDDRGGSEWEALAETLGAADYVIGTPEDLSISMLFLKFLEDASGNVCSQLVDREANGGEGNVFLTSASVDDTLQTNAEGVHATLAEAILRFHGRPVEVASPELEPWAFLFESASLVGGSPREGWRTVCVGLLTHPDFFTY